MAVAESLLTTLYGELRRVASAHLRRERCGHTLQTTALLHEAYLRLAGGADSPSMTRHAFYAAAVQAIRRVLLDYAKMRNRGKRGGSWVRLPLDSADLLGEARSIEYADLHDALEELEQVDPRLARVVELRFFCGLTVEEIAAALGCDRTTVQHHWRFARVWLEGRLGESEGRTTT